MHSETDKDDDYDAETDANGIFCFTKRVPGEVPVRKRNIHECKKRNDDAIDSLT